MDAKISGEFWSDPAIEGLTMEQRMAALWAITSSRTNMAGYVEVSAKRFSFETGCPYDALLTLCDAHPKGFKRCGEGIWIRRFIAHQIGTGKSLVRNKMTTTVLRDLRAYQGHPFVAHALAEYPELTDGFEVLEESSSELPPEGDGMHRRGVERSGEEQSGVEVAEKLRELPAALLRARALFRTRTSTPLDSSQIIAWKKNKGAVEATTEDDWRALEWWFLQPAEKNDAAEFRRGALGTLLNHWNDEITKARRAAVKDGVSFVGEKKTAAVSPAGWQHLLGESYPEMHLPAEFGELPESVRHWVLEKSAEQTKGGSNE